MASVPSSTLVDEPRNTNHSRTVDEPVKTPTVEPSLSTTTDTSTTTSKNVVVGTKRAVEPSPTKDNQEVVSPERNSERIRSRAAKKQKILEEEDSESSWVQEPQVPIPEDTDNHHHEEDNNQGPTQSTTESNHTDEPAESRPPDTAAVVTASTDQDGTTRKEPFLVTTKGKRRRRRRYEPTTDEVQTQETSSFFTDTDVVMGRGNHVNKLPGNLRFRRVVHPFRDAYNTSKDAFEKRRVLYQAYEAIVEGGNRFLEILNWNTEGINTAEAAAAVATHGTSEHVITGLFRTVPLSRAVEKVAQALREPKWVPPPPYTAPTTTTNLTKNSPSEALTEEGRTTDSPPTTQQNSSSKSLSPASSSHFKHVLLLPPAAIDDNKSGGIKDPPRTSQDSMAPPSSPHDHNELHNDDDDDDQKPPSRKPTLREDPKPKKMFSQDDGPPKKKQKKKTSLISNTTTSNNKKKKKPKIKPIPKMKEEKKKPAPKMKEDDSKPSTTTTTTTTTTESSTAVSMLDSMLDPSLRMIATISTEKNDSKSKMKEEKQKPAPKMKEDDSKPPTTTTTTESSTAVSRLDPSLRMVSISTEKNDLENASATKQGAQTTTKPVATTKDEKQDASTKGVLTEKQQFKSKSLKDKPVKKKTLAKHKLPLQQDAAKRKKEKGATKEKKNKKNKKKEKKEEDGLVDEHHKVASLDDLSEGDVLFGRGHHVNKHVGNIHFRKVIQIHKDAYAKLPLNLKRPMAQDIFDQFGGRFWEVLPGSKPLSAKDGFGTSVKHVLRRVETGRCIEKICQALREKYSYISKSKHDTESPSSEESKPKTRVSKVDSKKSKRSQRSLPRAKPTSSHRPPNKPTTDTPERIASGRRIAVYWPIDKTYYEAVVETCRDAASSSSPEENDVVVHKIRYVMDNECEWIDLDQHEFKFVDEGTDLPPTSNPKVPHQSQPSKPCLPKGGPGKVVPVMRKGNTTRQSARRSLFWMKKGGGEDTAVPAVVPSIVKIC